MAYRSWADVDDPDNNVSLDSDFEQGDGHNEIENNNFNSALEQSL